MPTRGLNPQQQAAVTHGDGPLLVLAGAGSGKTKVITCRIAYLIENGRIAPELILGVTFTNKAAREMRERLALQLGSRRSRSVTLVTFHALGLKILRQEAESLGYTRSFSIYSSGDQLRLLRELVAQAGGGGERKTAEGVLYRISAAKNRLLTPDQLPEPRGDAMAQLVQVVYPRYQQALQAYNAMDFDDLLLHTVTLLQENAAIRRLYQSRYPYLLVDEYQDTNGAQYALLRLLAGQQANLCVVGDDDQSIYSWRGAQPEHILRFEKDFAGARVLKLEQNYRSTQPILEAANAVIRHNSQRHGKRLWTQQQQGEPVRLVPCDDGEAEARAVAEGIQSYRQHSGCHYSDFAVLYRTNAQSRLFEEQLRFANVPYVLIGGQQFFERKEVKDVLAYLRLLVNPRDEVSLLRILNIPKRGIGRDSARRLVTQAAEDGMSVSALLEAAAGGEKALDLPSVAQQGVVHLAALLQQWRQRLPQADSLYDLAYGLLQELGFREHIYQQAEDPQQARRREENVQEVLNAVVSYEQRQIKPSLAGFLEQITLLDQEEKPQHGKEAKLAQDAVVLMSLHSSKGLEFPYVFMVGMEEEFLPHKRTLEADGDVTEERRLCYVGMTRACQQLTLTYARQRRRRGGFVPRQPSRFLSEVPAKMLECLEGSAVSFTPREEEAMAEDFFAQMQQMLNMPKEDS